MLTTGLRMRRYQEDNILWQINFSTTPENKSWDEWRKVEGVMGDRHISRKLKGKVLNSCITPAYLYGLEAMAMTENYKRDCTFARISGLEDLHE